MLPGKRAGFELDRRLEAATRPVMWLGLCELRVMDDRRWPWLVLVPQRPGVEEAHELTPLDQAMLTFEVNTVAPALKRLTGCDRVNVAALGNLYRQLHIHIIARRRGDPGWPGTVWDFGPPEGYRREELHHFIDTVRDALTS